MTAHKFQIPVNGRLISAVTTLTEAQPAVCHFIYAPGAGSNLNDPFGRILNDRLVTSGVSITRFQFPYMEDRKRRPDPRRVLEETWQEVISLVRSTATKVVVGGRSMGGRIASQVLAQGIQADGLALFAYPLRPPPVCHALEGEQEVGEVLEKTDSRDTLHQLQDSSRPALKPAKA